MKAKKSAILAIIILSTLTFTFMEFPVTASGETYGPHMDTLEIKICQAAYGADVPAIQPPWSEGGSGGGGWSSVFDSVEYSLEMGDIDIADNPLHMFYIGKWVREGRVPNEITLSLCNEIATFGFVLNNQMWPTGCDGVSEREGYNETDTIDGRTWNLYHTRQRPETSVGEHPPPITGEPYLGDGADYDPETNSWKVYHDPDCIWCHRAQEFRKALAHLANKDGYIPDVLEGIGTRIDTMVPLPVLEGWTDYSGLEEEGLIYHNATYSLQKTEAKQILNAAGFTVDDNDKRIDPRTGECLDDLIFYIPSSSTLGSDDYLFPVATRFMEDMEDVGISLNCKYDIIEMCYNKIWGEEDYRYHIFARGWSSPHLDVDFIFDEYHSKFYWSPMYGSPNIAGFCNLEFDEQAERIKYGTSFEEIKNATLEAQKIYADQVPVIDCYTVNSAKAYRTGWKRTVNMRAGSGIGNYFNFMNMRKEGVSTIKWGFSYGIRSLNLIWSINVERKILNLIYDSLIQLNPYQLIEEGMLANSWSTGTWAGGKNIVFTLRNDVKWHDNVSTLTPEDVKFSIEFMKACGWTLDAARLSEIDHVNTTTEDPNLGPMDVNVAFKSNSCWALHWVGFIPILNRKIWLAANETYGWGYNTPSWNPTEVWLYLPRKYDVYDAVSGGVGQDGINDLAQDGTGPWKFDHEWEEQRKVFLAANRLYYRSQTEISEYIEKSFHKVGNVNYIGSVHELDYENSEIGTDRVIDDPDIILMTRAYLTTPADPPGIDWDEWNVDADINEDGIVDDLDLAVACFFYGRPAGGSALPSLLKLPAQDQYNDTLTSDVYLDGQLLGNTSSIGFMVQIGTHEVFVNDFWEIGTTGYRYAFDHWGDNVTDNARNITIIAEETITVHFTKKLCPGDVNGDGTVDIVDLVTVGIAIGSQRELGDPWPPDGNWDSRADLNRDGIIDNDDLVIVATNWGKTY